MATDDLTAPLGREPKKRRRTIKIPVPQIIAGALALFLGIFVLWAVVADDPFGGEPMAVVPANIQVAAKPSEFRRRAVAGGAADADQSHGGQAAAPAASRADGACRTNTTTVTIIDGKTGARQEVRFRCRQTPQRRQAPQSAQRQRGPDRPEIRRNDAARPDSENRRRRHPAGRCLCAAGAAACPAGPMRRVSR